VPAGDEYFEDLLKVNLQYSGERNTAENVFFLSNLSAHGAAEAALLTLANSIGTKFAETILDYLSTAIGFIACTVADWTSADGLTATQDFSDHGSVSGDYPTDQVAVLLNEESLTRYRGGHGRMYLPTTGVSNMASGLAWTNTFVADMTAAAVAFIDYINTLSLGGDPCTFVLYHRGSPDVTQGFEEVVGITCSPTPGTQRRRVRRVGHLR
jgi:hypothetical protein